MPAIDLDLRIQRNPDLISVAMDGDVVMMSVSQGSYFGINTVGARVWELLMQPQTVGQLCAVIEAEFEVDGPRCIADVSAFVERMLAEGVATAV